ncbi:MAG: hypothetical protein ACI8T1_002939 [Verrucomicrobiales bacterium]|jgi:hypothetical protein
MDIKPKMENYLENAVKWQASMMKLPVDVMVSSMESIIKTMHEIQVKSRMDHAAGDGGEPDDGKTRVVGDVFKHSIMPLLGMFNIPRNVFASSMETISKSIKEINEEPAEIVSDDDQEALVRSFDRCIVPLSLEETKLEKEAIAAESVKGCSRSMLWKIGRSGRIEFHRKWRATFDYRIGEDVDAINSPCIPNFITVRDGPKPSGSTQKLNIHFELERDYSNGELAFIYDRWGGEKDEVFIDGKLLAPVSGAGEGMFKHVELLLKDTSSGKHVISITASGDVDADGHRIDYFELVAFEDAKDATKSLAAAGTGKSS